MQIQNLGIRPNWIMPSVYSLYTLDTGNNPLQGCIFHPPSNLGTRGRSSTMTGYSHLHYSGYTTLTVHF